MAVGVQVKGQAWFRKWGGLLLVGFAVLASLLSFVPDAWAGSSSPSDWDVQIESYSRGPNYCTFTVSLPSGYDGVNTYEYTATTDSNPYRVQHNSGMTANSDGTYTFFLYDMQGGGYDTYLKMTATDDAGDETSLPSDFFILQMDVAVYLDGISPDVLAELQDAWNNFEGVTPVGPIVKAGQDFQDAIGGVSFSERGGGDLAFTVPIIGDNPYGSPVNVTLFSSDELAQLTWLSVVRDALDALMWITFVLWMIQRFAPMFKA